jgi:hypothetical protein
LLVLLRKETKQKKTIEIEILNLKLRMKKTKKMQQGKSYPRRGKGLGRLANCEKDVVSIFIMFKLLPGSCILTDLIHFLHNT